MLVLFLLLVVSSSAMIPWQPGFGQVPFSFGVPYSGMFFPGGLTAPQVPGQNSWGWSFGGSIASSAQFQMGPDGQWNKVTGDVAGKVGTAEASNVNGQLAGSGGALGGGFSGSLGPEGWQTNQYGAACTAVLENGVETLKCDKVPK